MSVSRRSIIYLCLQHRQIIYQLAIDKSALHRYNLKIIPVHDRVCLALFPDFDSYSISHKDFVDSIYDHDESCVILFTSNNTIKLTFN